jgi:phosphoribosylglycinamide formyltransferase-1
MKHRVAVRYSVPVDHIAPRTATPSSPLRLGVLISGGGSGLAALLAHQSMKIHLGQCSHRTVAVIADSDAPGLEHARTALVSAFAVPLPDLVQFLEPGGDRDAALKVRRRAHEEAIESLLIAADVELVILSGYMRILTTTFVRKWKGRLVNVHPSLLPSFSGAHAHRDVLASGVEVTGCTVHFVDEGVDSGTIIAQREVGVESDDDELSLSERVKSVEHKLYPAVIDALSEGRVSITKSGVIIGGL